MAALQIGPWVEISGDPMVNPKMSAILEITPPTLTLNCALEHNRSARFTRLPFSSQRADRLAMGWLFDHPCSSPR
jgi:hypothetical protein